MNIKKIIFATDFSKTSKNAEAMAVQLRDRLEGELHVVHVFDPSSFEMPAPYYFMPGADHWLDERLSDLREKGANALKDYAADVGNCTPHYLEGTPGKELVALIEELHADLVVMGTHGHTGLDRILMGSVAEYVMRHTNAAVLSVKP